ncbi:MAG: hypothetical protein JNL79_38375 [Myxococcales bacterium]|nr:hypothetical protein [Myxococcales bacterium]
MRSLAILLVLASFAPGCADCSGKKEEVVPAPPAPQQAPVQQTPVTNHQVKKVMDLHPPGVPKAFAPAPSELADAGSPAADAKGP